MASSSPFLDPLQLWRDALTRLENDVNSLATGSLQSQEVQRAMHQFSSVSLGLEQAFEKVLAGYLRRANLPSRKEVAELAEALLRIESKLDRLLPADATPAPRPARTRRPSPADGAAAPAAAVPSEPAAPAARPRRTRKTAQG